MSKSGASSSVLMRSTLLVLAGTLALGGCSYLPSWMGGEKKDIERLPGERVAAIAIDSSLKPDDSVKAVAFSAPAATANSDWAQHSGNVKAAGGNLAGSKFASESSVTIGDGNDFPAKLVISPVVAAGLVYVMDAAGYISAHDAAHIGTVKWKSDGVSEEDAPDSFGGGLAYDNGTLYAVSGRGHVVAINAQTGQMLWRKAFQLPFRSPPRVSDGKLFATTLDNQLYVLQTTTGEVLWTHRGISETADIMHFASPALMEEKLILPYSSGEVYALSMADGQEVWHDGVINNQAVQSVSAFVGIGGDPIVDGDVIFATSSSGQTAVLHGKTGQHVWERPFGSLNTPWLSGDYLYVLTSDNTVICVVKYNGKIRWATRLASYADEKDKKDPIIWHGPVMVDGTIIVTGSDGQLTRMDAGDGTVLGTQSITDDIYRSPVVAGGRLYLVRQNATLYSFE